MSSSRQTLPTWASRSKFQYEGSVREGTTIYYGSDFRFADVITATQYMRMLAKFSGQEVSIGTSRTMPPKGSLGEWCTSECGEPAMTSYSGPILLREGYAERGARPDRIRIRSV